MSESPEPIRLTALPGIPSIKPGDDLSALIHAAAQRASISLSAGALVICQKIISKAEGRVVALSDVTPSPEAEKLAAEDGRDPRHTELVLRESARIVRRGHGVTISETKHGFVCANAGVDLSNAPAADTAVLLPLDPDASARSLREALLAQGAATPLAVIISDTFGRPWREGLVDVALGSAGIAPIDDLRGTTDLAGRELHATATATADQLAAAAGLLMQKDAGIPAVWIEGIGIEGDGDICSTLRDPTADLFR
jgi:coenzyme F420-0:L-glutamate ligase/coenzyme F420-1:gamma-L-glutamate ligase